MTNRTEESTPARDRSFTAAFALLVTALSCSLVLLSVPREVPASLPVLQLSRAEVAAQLTKDRALARQSADSPAARQLLGLVLEVGHQELRKHSVDRAFQQTLPKQLQQLESQLGRTGVEALRARTAERFMQALRGELADVSEARGLLGDQPGLLMSYGYLDSAGELLAPELSVRATYKVRWNLLFGRPPSEGLSRIERCAYEGFRGLEAFDMPTQIRSQALREFAKLGCRHGAEALAIWSAQNGDPAALIALARDPRRPASTRLRNMALGYLRREQAF